MESSTENTKNRMGPSLETRTGCPGSQSGEIFPEPIKRIEDENESEDEDDCWEERNVFHILSGGVSLDDTPPSLETGHDSLIDRTGTPGPAPGPRHTRSMPGPAGKRHLALLLASCPGGASSSPTRLAFGDNRGRGAPASVRFLTCGLAHSLENRAESLLLRLISFRMECWRREAGKRGKSGDVDEAVNGN